MVMGFGLVMIGRVVIGVFMVVCILFSLFLWGLLIGWVLVKVEGMLGWLLAYFCLFMCFSWAVLLTFCGLFFGVGACLRMTWFGGGLLGLVCLVFGIVFGNCFC